MSPERKKAEVPNGRNENRKPKAGARKIIAALLLAIGLIFILVPLVTTHINTRRNEDIIDQFLKEAEMAMSESSDISSDGKTLPEPDIQSEPSATKKPTEDVEVEQPDVSTNAEDSSGGDDAPSQPSAKKPLMSKEEIQKRMTGVLIIEKINLKMIIMDGVDEETLRVAAGRMPGTGKFDEIGNVVLAGHRSYTFGKYFNRLDELEPGDRIVVQTKDKKLEYEVYRKHVIEPDDISILEQSETEKILTLFTCHPVVIANKRLVVHARQIN